MDEYSQEAEAEYKIGEVVIPKGHCVFLVMRVFVGKRYINTTSPSLTKVALTGKFFLLLLLFPLILFLPPLSSCYIHDLATKASNRVY